MNRRHVIAFLIYLAVALLFYGKTLSYPFFIFDDLTYIVNNPFLAKLSAGNWNWIWGTSAMPVPYTIWAFLIKLFGNTNPVPFRVLNLLVHAINTLLVAVLVERVMELFFEKGAPADKGRSLVPFAAAFLFLLHPVQVETVVWISCLKDLLFGLFSLLALQFYFRTFSSECTGNRLVQTWGIVGVFFALAILSKPAAIVLIPLMLFFEILGKEKRQLRTGLGVLLAFSAVLAVPAIRAYQARIPGDDIRSVLSVADHLVMMAEAFIFDISQLFVPRNFYFNYALSPWRVLFDSADAPVYSVFKVLAVVIFAGAFLWPFRSERFKGLRFVSGFVFIASAPSFGFVLAGSQGMSLVADRFLYFAVIGVVLGATLLWLRVVRSWKMRGAVVALTLALLGVQSWFTASHWSSSVECLSYAVDSNPLADVSHEALSYAYLRENKVTESVQEFEIAEKLRREMQASWPTSRPELDPYRRIFHEFPVHL